MVLLARRAWREVDLRYDERGELQPEAGHGRGLGVWRGQTADGSAAEVRRTSARAALLATTLGAASLTFAGPAGAATCSGTSGVSVVVDFGARVQTGCAAGDPTSAWGALESAGFAVEGTQRFPTTFICRVAGFPTADVEPCVQTPSASAYWSVWSASAGGSWAYSSTGAATLNPAPGSVVGVAFGAGAQPSVAPPAPPSATTPPATTPPASTTTSSTTRPPTSPSATGTGSAPASTAPSATKTSSGEASSTSDPPASSASEDTSAAGATEKTTDTSAPATSATALPDSGTSGGASPALIVGGGAGVGALLILGAWVVRRQRDRAAAQ
ncbi:conserved hypothetical protein [Nostocoides jenkinsii Ben 74]|uniref:Uncharacterized protein n=1 Tax=Nostocoides jenkinsii Ben 74 TaxID=1193518 RepID=A0A077M9G1_9MICO|nr:conserved hypothetical protein [Tetrasphaera jenkinsii Ben 74]